MEGQGGRDEAWGDGHSVTPTQVAIPGPCHPEIRLQALSGSGQGEGRGLIPPEKQQCLRRSGFCPHSGVHLIFKKPCEEGAWAPLYRLQMSPAEEKRLVQSYTAWK